MLRRPVLSRIHKYQRFVNFCIFNNGGHSLASSEKSLVSRYVVSYLVNSCGLSQEKAISAAKRVRFDGPDKPNAVMDFLKIQGFTKTQIADLVTRYPQILRHNPEKSLLPKIEFLMHSTGISEKEVTNYISRYPALLSRSFNHKVVHVYNYIKDIIGAGRVDTLLRRGSWIFYSDLENGLIPNVDFLRELGMPQGFIELALTNYSEIFLPKHGEFRKIVEEVRQMGFDPLKSTFVFAIHARTGKGNRSLWDRCSEVYSKWGWSKNDILMAFRKHPNCMLLSEKKISAAMDFIVNKVEREPRSVKTSPQILFYSLEKRIVPRCSVVHLLSLKGILKKDWSLTSVLCPAEEKFLDKYVTTYRQKLPQLYDIYQSKKVKGVEA